MRRTYLGLVNVQVKFIMMIFILIHCVKGGGVGSVRVVINMLFVLFRGHDKLYKIFASLAKISCVCVRVCEHARVRTYKQFN